MDTSDSFSEEWRCRNHLDFVREISPVWFSTVSVIISFLDGTLVNTGYSMLRQHPVGDCGVDFSGPMFHQLLCYADQRAAGDGEVIDDDCGFSFDVANDLQDDGFLVMGWPLFIGDGNRGFEIGAIAPGLFGEADVRGDDNDIFQAHCLDTFAEEGQGVEIIYRQMEEALDLWCVQIHRDDAIRTKLPQWHQRTREPELRRAARPFYLPSHN